MARTLRCPVTAPVLLLLAFAVTLTLAACGSGGGTNPACPDGCFAPPPPTCDGANRVTFSPLGECVDGGCVYTPVSATCEFGCADGSCGTDPCDGVSCDDPPAPACEGDTLVTSTAGACDPDTGACLWGETQTDCAARDQVCREGRCVTPGCCEEIVCSEAPAPTCAGSSVVTWSAGECDPSACACEPVEVGRVDCRATGQVCVDGACVENDLCRGVSCEVPPAPTCDGSVAVSFGTGVCQSVTGRCEYEEVRTDCFEEGLACVDGACVASTACDGVVCDTIPAPVCDGDRIATATAAGRCDATTGACRYPTDYVDCAAEGLGCFGAECIDTRCIGVTCAAPPADRCTSATELQVWDDAGECGAGRCAYGSTAVDCAATGQVCLAGRCTDAPFCDGVRCDDAPPAECRDDVLVEFLAPGSCDEGVDACIYPERATDCIGRGLRCRDGACRPPCEGVVCDDAPAPTCDGDVAVVAVGGGVCVEGACRFFEERVDCSLEGQKCVEGACRPLCFGVDCEEPPPAYCVRDLAVTFTPGGVCDPATGGCRFADSTRNCLEDGLVCIGGACVVDPCPEITCDTPPAPTCDGVVAVGSLDVGICDHGECLYVETRRDCVADGLSCVDGECVDACAGVVCDEPPAAYCEGTVLVSPGAGSCDLATASCRYAPVFDNCASRGLVCRDAACVPDPCLTLECDDAPAPFCEDEDLVVSAAPGVCNTATADCTYSQARIDCVGDFGGACSDGRCSTPCDALSCLTPPEPVCAGDTVVAYDEAGECDPFTLTCSYALSTRNCVAEGLICRNGDCEIDRCDGVVCASPPPSFCEGDTRYTYLAASGACDPDTGTCDYDLGALDCGTIGRVCRSGQCVSRCDGVVCNDPPDAFCLGDTLLAGRVPGLCDPATGGCSYPLDGTNCTLNGAVCIDDACVVLDPCEGITCEEPLAPNCDGTTVVTYGAGACEAGECVYAEAARIDCAADGRFCFDGACVGFDPCEGVVCAPPGEATCQGNFVVTQQEGVCVAGGCEYGFTLTACAEDEFCDEGVCELLDRCAGVVCDTPPPAGCSADGRRIVFGTPAECVEGTCNWTVSFEDCRASGLFCDDGVCVASDPCIGVVCDTPPADVCDDTTAVLYSEGTGTCLNGACAYTAVGDNCLLRGRVCVDGACTEPEGCEGIVCEDPPADRCESEFVLRRFSLPGTCDGGLCSYNDESIPCAVGIDDPGRCVDGACITPDPCFGVTCSTPPAPQCQDDVSVVFGVPGTCVEGECAWAERRTDCAALGQFCFEGVCTAVDPCSGVSCATPPAPSCRGSIAVVSIAPGVCGSGICAYPVDETDCAETGQFCFRGACQAVDPCVGVVCDDPPAEPFCDVNFASQFVAPGECVAGECQYPRTTRDCSLIDATCEAGLCVGGDPCLDVVCDAPPDDGCDGDLVINFRPPEVCVDGVCIWSEFVDEDCSIAGQTCYEGRCVLPGATIQPGELVITEISPAGAAQWFEIWNATDRELDVNGMFVDVGPLGGAPWVIAGAPPLPPGGHHVFGSSAAAVPAGVDASWQGQMTLDPGSDSLRLFGEAGQIDAVSYGVGWPFTSTAAAQLSRPRYASDNASVANWCVATAEFAAGRRGTPGAENGTCD